MVDKLRLSKVACDSFLLKTREEFMEKLQEKKGELILDYSLNQGIDPCQAKTLSLREGTPDLEIPNEEYATIFWNFLETKAEVARAMRAQSRPTGLLMTKPNYVGNFRSNRIDPQGGYGNEQPQGNWRRRCAFKNCKSTDHYTRRCDMNLKPGSVQENVQQLCQDASLCLRCLGDLNYVNHDERCKGGYTRQTDNKWVSTDCKTCTVTLPGGKVVSLNKRVCHHIVEGIKSKKRKATTTSPGVNLVNVGEESEYEVPSAMVYKSSTRPVSNKLIVNHRPCGEASQLVEWVNMKEGSELYPVLVMYDLGTSCSVIDLELARKCGLEGIRADFTVSTVAGVKPGEFMYSFYLLDQKGDRVKVQALGVDMKSQYYPMTKVRVRSTWKEAHYNGQSYQTARGGKLGLLIGSDIMSIHPRQISVEENEALWRSVLTGRYLITGGQNIAAREPIINKIAVSVPREPRKANLAVKKLNTRIEDGVVVTMVEDMKEKVFKQLTGMDAVLVTPCIACPTCKADTDRMADQDLLEYEAMKKTVKFDPVIGKYKGDLLYIEDRLEKIKDNSNLAKRNSESLYRKLKRLPAESIKDFDDALNSAKEMGALKRTSEVEGINLGHPRRHIPINFAFSGKESSTKIRPTFNCAWSGGHDDLSFNDLHLTGPRNLNNLDQSMLFFKTNVIVGLVDVKKFFWTCLVSTRTASLNRIWLPESGYSEAEKDQLNLQEWCWTTLTFGQAGAPALSGIIRHKAAEDFCQLEEVKNQVKQKALVDDILIGASNRKKFEAYQMDVEQMLEKSGMKYHDWVVSGIKSGHVVDFEQQPIKEGTKVFGYQYDQESDQFSLNIKINLARAVRGKKFAKGLQPGEDPMVYLKNSEFTKRKALGFTLSLWDLTGWVLPIQMLLRLQYRDLLEDHKGLKWDDEVPSQYQVRYASMFKRLLTFHGLRWHRAVVPTANWDEDWGCRLATFFDGSEVASVSYTYIVTLKKDGSLHSRMLWGKGKLGCGSVPRNELGAAFLAVKMNNFLEQHLQIKIRDITYFGDSQAVLYQIGSRSILYDSWARARLRAIQQGSRGSKWLYIPSKENVADIGSKNSSRISRETMESDFYQKGNFLEEDEWKGVSLGKPSAGTIASLPEIRKCYRTSPVTHLNNLMTMEGQHIEDDLKANEEGSRCFEEELCGGNNWEIADEKELQIISNNMLGKYKRTPRVTKINKNLEKDKIPDLLISSKRRLEKQTEDEYFAALLLKYRSFEKVCRILEFVLKWRYGSEVCLKKKVQDILTCHAAIATIRYLCSKGVGFGPLRIDSQNRVWVQNRPLLEKKVSRVLPEETLIVAPTTCLARLLARSYHDKNHWYASTSVQTTVRTELNVRIPTFTKMLEEERAQCTKCIHHQRTPYKPKEAGVPLQRHSLRNKPFTSICIDGVGPFRVKSLHREDRRTMKVWALIAVDQPTGLAHISLLMDSSTHSVQVALELLKIEWNVDIDLVTLDPATSFVGLQEDETTGEVEGFDLQSIQGSVIKAGYHLKISPPKASWFQALCEKRIDLIKTALYFQPKRCLHVIELELILKRIVLDLNNKPIVLKQSQDNFLSLSRMDLLGKFYHPSESKMFRTGKTILKDIELIEECIQESRQLFNEAYTESLKIYSKWRYEGVTPVEGDIVGVPDKDIQGEPRMGRVIEITSPQEVLVEMARPKRRHPYPLGEVTVRRATFRRSPHSLYLIERPTASSALANLRMFDMRKIEAGPQIADFIEEYQEGEQPKGWEELTDIEEEPIYPVLRDEDEAQQDDDPNQGGEMEEIEHYLGRGRRTKFPRTIFSYRTCGIEEGW